MASLPGGSWPASRMHTDHFVQILRRRLYRSHHDRKLVGVCGGIGEYTGLDPTWFRLAFVVLFFVGPGMLAYVIAALIMPGPPGIGR